MSAATNPAKLAMPLKVDRGFVMDANGSHVTLRPSVVECYVMLANEAASLREQLTAAREDAERLAEALRVMTDHAGEHYPHFEDTRGQRDIAASVAALAAHAEATKGGAK